MDALSQYFDSAGTGKGVSRIELQQMQSIAAVVYIKLVIQRHIAS